MLLARGKMEKAQCQHPRAIGDAAQQLAAATVGDLRELDFPFDRGARAGEQRADKRDLRAVFVAQRQQEQEIGDPCHAELRQTLREGGADPAQCGDRAFPGG